MKSITKELIIENFELKDLIGKDVIGGRKGGMPEMTLEYILTKNNIMQI